MISEWKPAPAQYNLAANRVDVWLILIDDRTTVQALTDLLAPEEIVRAARFKFDKDRRLFVAAHAGLRAILANYLHDRPAELKFTEGRQGKPKFPVDSPWREVEFNLSHSHHAALVAVALRRAVGVDVEFIKRDFEFDEVAERFFTAREAAALRGLPRDLQRQAFFKCWTGKEAFLKAKGTGLSGQLDEVEIVLKNDSDVRVSAAVQGWTLSELNSIDGYEAALVYNENPAAIHHYLWKF